MDEILIQTPRLVIRKPKMDDLNHIHAAKTQVWPELQKWMSWAYDTEADIASTRRFIEAEAFNPLCGFIRETQDFVVSTGIDVAGPDEYATGYWVAEKYLGQGYATEATNAILRYAFNVLNAKAVHINYYGGNDKSRRVIEKLGFEFVHTECKAKARCSNGELLDVHNYIMRDTHKLPALEVTWS